MSYTLGDGMVALALAAGVVGCLHVIHQSRRKRLEIIHQERLVAMEKGIPLPELPLEPSRDPGGPDPDDTALSDAVTAEPGPHSRLETAQRDQALSECIQALPEVYQSALRLYYWMGASVADAAALLDVPENTVKSYLHRARRLLDEMLKERGYSNV